MKITFVSILLSILFLTSNSRRIITKHFPFERTNSIDSSIITIPFPIKMNNVSEAYITQKNLLIQQFYNKYIGSPWFSGGFIVAKNGHILFENYQGLSNVKNNTPITASTAIHLASVSKVLTATAVLKLVDGDNIQLDQLVTDWIPKFPYKSTTIRMLLNHRSGIQHYSRFPYLMKKSWNRKKLLTNQDILNILIDRKVKLIYKLDTKFDYCNTNYVILALIIEKATGMNYRQAMQVLIFKPLGMKNTFVFNYATDRDRVSMSYKGKNIAFPWDQFDQLYGDKNIYSTPRDLIKFDLASYSSDYINPEILKEAYIGYSPQPKTMKNYGLGMRMKEWPTGQRLTYHNGWWHGNNTSYTTMKKDTVTIICLSNKYSAKPYQSLKLSSIFGDYPFEKLELDSLSTE
jgi:CubicO group peptidase (beta-lactamase class C family)